MYTIVVRLCFVLLALGWGVLVFGFHQKLGYEKAYGYPPVIESVVWACLLAAPFVLGAFFLASRTVVGRVIRLVAAIALSSVLYLMLFVVWMWDFRMIVAHIRDGTFLNAFFIIFILGPPVLIALTIGLLLAPEVAVHLKKPRRL